MRYVIALFLALLVASPALAKVNEKYSYKDFMGQSFTDVNASEFSNSEIIGSNFYHEAPQGTVRATDVDKVIFPVGMTGVTFTKCNLDNIFIPIGNTIGDENTNKRIKVQNDLMDWVLDGSLDPVEPVGKEAYLELGLSIDPIDLPTKMASNNVIHQKEKENAEAFESDVDALRLAHNL